MFEFHIKTEEAMISLNLDLEKYALNLDNILNGTEEIVIYNDLKIPINVSCLLVSTKENIDVLNSAPKITLKGNEIKLTIIKQHGYFKTCNLESNGHLSIIQPLKFKSYKVYIASGISISALSKAWECTGAALNIEDTKNLSEINFALLNNLAFEVININSKSPECSLAWAREVSAGEINITGKFSECIFKKVTARKINYKASGDLSFNDLAKIELLSIDSPNLYAQTLLSFSKANIGMLNARSLTKILITGEFNAETVLQNIALDINNDKCSNSGFLAKDAKSLTIKNYVAKVYRFSIGNNFEFDNVIIEVPRRRGSSIALNWEDGEIATRAEIKDSFLIGGITITETEQGVNIKDETLNPPMLTYGSDSQTNAGNADTQVTIGKLEVKEMRVISEGSLAVNIKDIVKAINALLRSATGEVTPSGKLLVQNRFSVESPEAASWFLGADIKAKLFNILAKGNVAVYNSNINVVEAQIDNKAHLGIINSNVRAEQAQVETKGIILIGNSEVSVNRLSTTSQILQIIDSSVHTKQGSLRSSQLITQGALFTEHPNLQNIAELDEYRLSEYASITGIVGDEYTRDIKLSNTAQTGQNYIYFESDKALFLGSRIDHTYVKIKTRDSLEIIPTTLHNFVIQAGGYKAQYFDHILSSIMAKTIDIEAGKAAIFMGVIMKAAQGSIIADTLSLLDAPKVIEYRENLNSLTFNFLPKLAYNDISVIFRGIENNIQFTDTASVELKKGYVSLNMTFGANKAALTQGTGDITINQSFNTHNILLNAKAGKVLIETPCFRTDQLTDLNADSCILMGEEIEIKGAIIKVKNNLKLISKHGVSILPISVFNSFESHVGRTKDYTYSVKQIISEINAGVLDVDAGGAFEIVSGLIKATKVKIKAEDIKLNSAKEIFDKQTSWLGRKKWYGSRDSSYDREYKETNILTTIEAKDIEFIARDKVEIEGALISASNIFNIYADKGKILIKNVRDVHLISHKSTDTSFFSGGSFFSSKDTDSSNNKDNLAPTIIYANNQFYGYCGGKFILAASTVTSDRVIIEAKEGIVFEAAPGRSGQLLYVDESGFMLGFDSSNGSYDLKAGAYNKSLNQELSQIDLTRPGIFTNNLTLISKEGKIEAEAADIVAKEAYVEAKSWIFKPAYKELNSRVSEQQAFIGVKAGVDLGMVKLFNKMKSLEEQRVNNPLAVTQTSLKLYEIWRSMQTEMQTAKQGSFATYGVGISASVSSSEFEMHEREVVNSMLAIGKLRAKIEDIIQFEAVDYKGEDFTAEAREFFFKSAASSREVSESRQAFEIYVSLKGTRGHSLNASDGGSSSYEQTYAPCSMRLSGVFKLKVSKAGVIGAEIDADIVDIDADNLLVKSVQDVVRNSGYSFSLSLDPSKIMSDPQGSLKDIYGEKGKFNAAFTRQMGNILGRSAVKIIVKDNIELAGGLIANAERDARGNLTDKGNMNIRAGNLIMENLADFDNGTLLGLGLAPSSNELYEDEYRIKAGYKDRTRDVYSRLGQGTVIIGGKEINLAEDINARTSEFTGPDLKFEASFAAPKPQTPAPKKYKEPEEEEEHKENEHVDEDDIKENEAASTKAKSKTKTKEISLSKEETEALKKAIAQKFSSLPKEKQEELFAYFKGTYQQIKQDPKKFTVLVDAGRPLLASNTAMPMVMAEVAALTPEMLAVTGLVSIVAAGALGATAAYIYRNEIIDGIQACGKYVDKIIKKELLWKVALELQEEMLKGYVETFPESLEAGRPFILVTPDDMREWGVDVETFPDHSEELTILTKLPGFKSYDGDQIDIESLPADIQGMQIFALAGRDDNKVEIIRGSDGRIIGVTHTQVHHIIPQALKDHEIWKLSGIGNDAKINKILLPTARGAELMDTYRTIHQGRHVKEVDRELREKMRDIVEAGKANNYTEEQYKEKLIKVISDEYQDLRNGLRKLNKHENSKKRDIK